MKVRMSRGELDFYIKSHYISVGFIVKSKRIVGKHTILVLEKDERKISITYSTNSWVLIE